MSQVNCAKCNKEIDSKEVIKTDEFKEYGSKVKNYCPTCFLESVKKGFGNIEIGNCDICNSPMVLQFDDEESISVAQDDFTVHYVCEKLKKAYERDNEEEIDRLENEDHEWLILYTIQPAPDETDIG